jgi:hypothetical protein
MLRQRRSSLRLMAAAALVTAGACGDQRTPTVPLAASDAPSLVQAGGGKSVKVKQVQLSTNTLRIDGPGITASVVIGNPGAAIQSGISVRGEIAQPAARRRAFDVPTQCLPGDPPGFLASSECSMSIQATARNGADGPDGVGTLVPGSALFVVTVIQTTDGTEVELATKSVTVNLVATPSIATLTLASTTLAIDGTGTGYTATLQNPAKSLQSVALQGYIVQGTTRRAAGGVQVMCGSNTGVLPPGTCTINFATSASNAGSGAGTLVPGAAKFELNLFQVVNGVSTTFDTKLVDITLLPNTPFISSLVLDNTSIVLGSGVDYTVQLLNYGPPQSDILLQGEMVQGSVVKGAGGFTVDCGSGLGNLPTTGGTSCSLRLTANASSDDTGGAFVPGTASFVLHLYRTPLGGTQVEYDTKTVTVTLVANTPTLTSVTPAVPYVPLDGGFTGYKAVIANPGPVVSSVVLQGWISQGSARRAAGGVTITCDGGPIGVLPSGQCIVLSDIVASNDPIVVGVGTLALGPATFEVELKVNGTIVDTKTAPIILVPNTPSIVKLELDPDIAAIGGSTHFNATVYNPGTSTLSGVGLQGYITQGNVEAPAGGLSVTCPATGMTGTVVPGACNVRFTVNPSNALATGGVLVAGPAQYVLKLYIGGVVQDTKSVPINLTN